jgi:two-component system, NarL family, sensor kinase
MIRHSLSITAKLMLSYLAIAGLVVGLVSVVFYYAAEQALLNRAAEQLSSVKALKKGKVELLFTTLRRDAQTLAAHPTTQKAITHRGEMRPAGYYDSFFASIAARFACLYFITTTGDLFYLYPDSLNRIPHTQKNFRDSTSSVSALRWAFQPLLNSSSPDTMVLTDFKITSPSGTGSLPPISAHLAFHLNDDSGKRLGVAVGAIAFAELNAILTERTGLGETGESYIVGDDFVLRTNSRFSDTTTALKLRAQTESVMRAFRDTNSSAPPLLHTTDYRGVRVLSASQRLNIAGLNWAIVSEMDYDEVIRPINDLRARLIWIIGVVLCAIGILSFIISRRIAKPVRDLKILVDKASLGELPKTRADVRTHDEIGEMTRAINRLFDTILTRATFADEIGNGNFSAPFAPLSEHDVFGKRLVEMQAKLKTLTETERQLRNKRTAALLEGEEQERRRISKDLHDGLGQLLTAIKFHIETIADTEKRQELRDLLHDAIEETRAISSNLMPRVLVDFGLVAALEQLSKKAPPSVEVHFDRDGAATVGRLPAAVEVSLFRIAQEAFSNALNYAQASVIRISLQIQPGSLVLIIADNGVGFDVTVDATSSRAAERPHHGLTNMAERAALLGGVLHIHSTAHQGTTVQLTLTDFVNTHIAANETD